MKAIILYARYVSVCIRCRMAYRISFLLAVLSRFLVAFCGVIALSFLFSGFEHIKGYTYTDVLLCYAVMEMSFSLSESCGVKAAWRRGRRVRTRVEGDVCTLAEAASAPTSSGPALW